LTASSILAKVTELKLCKVRHFELWDAIEDIKIDSNHQLGSRFTNYADDGLVQMDTTVGELNEEVRFRIKVSSQTRISYAFIPVSVRLRCVNAGSTIAGAAANPFPILPSLIQSFENGNLFEIVDNPDAPSD
jgi:hypothetical protein